LPVMPSSPRNDPAHQIVGPGELIIEMKESEPDKPVPEAQGSISLRAVLYVFA
jgi:hypothetical protein